MDLVVVILAAGKGKRMHSAVAKVLHTLAGKPLLEHVIDTVGVLKPKQVYVVYGTDGDQVLSHLQHKNVKWIEQEAQLGTAHAVLQVLPHLKANSRLLILYGDVPLISIETLKHILDRTPNDAIGWLTASLEDPTSLGRILRDADGNPVAIIEEQDATESEKQIKEINTGICLIPVKYLHAWLPQIKNDNKQKEYYLTDIFKIALEHGVSVTTVSPYKTIEIFGVNNNVQLAHLERVYQQQKAEEYMLRGLTLRDPDRFDVRGELFFEHDVVIDINVVVEGDVKIGAHSYIGPNVYLKDVEIGDNVEIKANTMIEGARIEDDCVVGPFARIRPETHLLKKSKVGNFVEIKKGRIGAGSKVNHLTYIGDAEIGSDVNIGAGTITCNYDGVNKYKTIIEKDVFIGSNTALVAPVKIGLGATVGAGSVITEDVPKGKLVLARARQTIVKNWKRPQKKK